MKLKKALMGAILASLLSSPLLAPQPANAVTYGNPVDDPLTRAPYVVSIWASEKGDVRLAEFICTGTLISANVVLTAAHCVDFKKVSFFVKTGAVALQQETALYPATPWKGTRYDPKSIDGDIGLLRLNTKISGYTFPSLANANIAKLINSKTRLTLMGWGTDQNGDLADTLHYSNLTLQDSAARKVWGKFFNQKTMLGAGKYIKAEKKWSGSCRGDSGGPLLATLNGIEYVVGITSWGAADCRLEKPSIFTRVSYFEKDIRSGIKAVELLANTVNRLAPIEVIAPVMQGDGTPGSTLTCNSGTWENVVVLETSWLSPNRLVGTSNPSTKIISADAGLEFKCRVIAISKSGDQETTVTRTLSRVLPKKLAVASPPVIGGLEGSDVIKVGSVARCEGWNWAEPVDKEVVQWFTTSTGSVTTPVNGKLIGTGIELPITSDFLKNEKNRYLVCQLTGTRDGFPSYLVATKYISTPTAPVINDVSVRTSGLRSGSSASCNYSGGNAQALVNFEWGYSGAGNTFSALPGQTADFIQITPQVIRAASGQKLACKVTISYQGEITSKVGTSFEIFETALEAPKVTVFVPASPYSGSSASCNIPSSNKYTGTTYEWGISTSPQSSAFTSGVLGRTSTFTFDGSSLLTAAGNYLVCVVTVENEVGKAQGSASGLVSVNAAASLPFLSAFSVSSQTKSSGSVNAVFAIPSVYGFDSNFMEVRLRMPGASCDGAQIFTFSTSFSCSGLSGSRSYSGYLEVKYKVNPSIPSRQSSTTTFTTIDASLAPSITLSNGTQTITAGSPMLIATVNNTGGPVNSNGFSISPSLPSGLTFNTATGAISGTPNQAQSLRSYTVTASGLGGSSTAVFTLTVVAAEVAPQIALSNSVQNVTLGNEITTVISTNLGGSINTNGYSISPALPSGLNFNTSTGSISGTPTQAQTLQSYSVTATGLAGISTATFTLTVLAQVMAPSISLSNSVQSVNVGNQILTVSTTNVGGTINPSGYTISPNLPAGLSFNSSNGSISGTPSQAQTSRSYTITATGIGGTSSATFTLTVNAPVPKVVAPSQPAITGIIATPNSLAISWNPPSSDGGSPITEYWAYVESVNGTTVSYCSTGGTLSCTARNLTPGTTYRVIVSAWNSANGVNLSSGDQFSPRTVTATLAAIDDQAPVVNASTVQISPTLLNENGTLMVVVPAQDNVGVTGVQVTIYRSSDYPTSPAANTSTTFTLTRVLGTPQSGNWSGTQGMNIKYGQSDGYLGEGYYNVNVRVSDAAGNVTQVTLSNAYILGMQGSGPYITNTTTLPITNPISSGGFFKIQTRISAYGHSISSAMARSDGNNMNFNVNLVRVSGSASDGIYEATISLANNQAAGTFTYWIEAGTNNGRAGTRVDVPVVIVGADVTSPVVASYSGTLASPSITGQIVSVPGVGNVSDGMATNSDFTVTFQVTDNTAVASAILCVDSSSEDRIVGILLNISGVGNYGINDGRCIPAQLISGNASSGTYSAMGRFPSVATLAAMGLGVCGRYTVRAQAIDEKGNRSPMTTVRKIDIVTCRS
jgi:hypothetical protein